jgi:hypothetical protein
MASEISENLSAVSYPRSYSRYKILTGSITSSFGGRFSTKEGNFLLNKFIVVQNTL